MELVDDLKTSTSSASSAPGGNSGGNANRQMPTTGDPSPFGIDVQRKGSGAQPLDGTQGSGTGCDPAYDLTPRSTARFQQEYPSRTFREGAGCKAEDWWNYAPPRTIRALPENDLHIVPERRTITSEELHSRAIDQLTIQRQRAIRVAVGSSTAGERLDQAGARDRQRPSTDSVPSQARKREVDVGTAPSNRPPASEAPDAEDCYDGDATLTEHLDAVADDSRRGTGNGDEDSTLRTDGDASRLWPAPEAIFGKQNPCRQEEVRIHHRMPSYFWQQRRAYKAGVTMPTGTDWDAGWHEAEGAFAMALNALVGQPMESPEGSELVVFGIMSACRQQDDLFGAFLLEHAHRLHFILAAIQPHIGLRPEYRDSVLTIFSMLQKPLLALNVKECVEYAEVLVRLVNITSMYLRCDDDDIVMNATLFLCKWATSASWPSTHDAVRDLYLYQPIPYALHEAAVETSYAALQLMNTWDPTSRLKRDVFIRELILILAEKDMCRQQIASSDRVRGVIFALATYDPDTREYQQLLGLISKLLMYEDDDIKAAPAMATRECLEELRRQLHRLVVPKSVKFLLSMRNELVHVMLMIASQVPSAPFVSSGLLQDLCLLATFTEVKSNQPLVHNLVFREYHDDEDFLHADVTLKGTLMVLLSVVATTPWTVAVMEEQYVLQSLLLYVRQEPPPQFPFSVRSFGVLQQYAMTTLLHVAPRMLGIFLAQHGTTSLLLFVEYLCSEECFTPNVSKGAAIRLALSSEQQVSLLEACFQILYAVVRSDDGDLELVKTDLLSQGAVEQIRGFVVDVIRKSFVRRMERLGIHEASVSNKLHSAVHLAVRLLNLLHCESHPQYDPDDADSFAFLTEMLDLVSGQENGVWVDVRKSDEAVPLAILDSIHHNIVNYPACEEKAFSLGLIFKLLNILQISRTGRFQTTLIKLLSDLADNGSNIAHFQTWSVKADGGSAEINVHTLMARLWRECEHEAGVERSSGGGIVDTRAPLLTREQMSLRRSRQGPAGPASSYSVTKGIRSYPSVLEVTTTLRAAIANILHKTGPVPEGMSGRDRVTMTTINFYLDMKCLEAIQDTVDDLDRHDIPVTPVWMQWLAECLRYASERVNAAMELQVHYGDSAVKSELSEEAKHFREKLSWGRLEKLVEKDNEKRLLLASRIEALEAEAKRKGAMIHSERRKNGRPKEGIFHDVTLPALRTKVSGAEVTIECTPSLLASVRASRNPEARKRLARTVPYFNEDEYVPLSRIPSASRGTSSQVTRFSGTTAPTTDEDT